VNVAQHILVAGVRLYRWTLSPAKTFLFGPMGGCRFEPSCSAYALDSLRLHGAIKGTWLALKRICRCHPWGACGEDPVPPANSETCPACSCPALPANRSVLSPIGHSH